MSRGGAFDAAKESLLSGAHDQVAGGDVGGLVKGGAKEQLAGSGATDLVSGGAREQLAGGGSSVWKRGA